MPSFAKRVKQVIIRNVEQSRRLAGVRIHVERMMERVENFRKLGDILPLLLVPYADNNLMISAAFSNLQPRLTK